MKLIVGSTDIGIMDFETKFTVGVKDVREPLKRESAFSSPLIIPATPANKKALGVWDEATFANTLQKQSARLTHKGWQFNGTLKAVRSERDGGKSQLAATLIGDNYGWLKYIAGKKVNELDMEATLAHTYTATAIKNSWTVASGRDYIYPLIDYGHFLQEADGYNVYTVDMFPAVNVFSVLQKIFNEAGYEVVSDWFDTDGQPKKYGTGAQFYMPFTRAFFVRTEEDVASARFKAGLSDTDVNSQLIEGGNTESLQLFDGDDNQRVPFDRDSGEQFNDNGSNYDSLTDYEYTVPDDGGYAFETRVNLLLDWYKPIAETTVKIEIIKDDGSETVMATTGEVTQYPTGAVQYHLKTSYESYSSGDKVFVRLTVTGLIDNERAWEDEYYTCKILTQNSFFMVHPIRRRAANWEWTGAEMLPDMLQTEFISLYKQLGNLIFVTDEGSKKVYIEPDDTMFTGAAKDWSGKVDLSRTQTIAAREIPARVEVLLQEDSHDKNVKSYNKANATPLQGRVEETDNANTRDIITIENEYAASTYMATPYRLGMYDQVPTLWDFEDLEEAGEIDYDFEPRVLFYDGETALSAGSWKLEGETQSVYPKFTPFTFQSYWYYQHYMKRVDRLWEFSCFMHLTRTDIERLLSGQSGYDLRSPVYLDAPFMQGYFNVVRIKEFNPQRNEPVEVYVEPNYNNAKI